jgi:hypothetical protein
MTNTRIIVKNFLGLTMLLLLGGLILGGKAHAGATVGPCDQESSVQAYGTESYRLRFDGGAAAEVLLEGDGTTDLDLFVYDEFGNLIASDTDGDDFCVARWFPRWTGVFYIQVINHGPVENTYRIETN